MIRSSLVVTAGSALTMLMGFFTQVVTAAYFGTSGQMDAFMTALAVPAYVQALTLTILPTVLVPIVINEFRVSTEVYAWGIAGRILRIFVISMLISAVCGCYYSWGLINWTAPGFPGDIHQLAANMLAIMIFALPCMAVEVIAGSVHHIRGNFFWPASAPAFGAISNILFITLGYDTIGATSLAWAEQK